jgi:hypothetical protein
MHTQENDPSMTKCTEKQLEFPGVGQRQVVGRFGGAAIGPQGGELLLG